MIHMVRHAEGTHNVEENYRDHDNIDARLTTKGKEQCKKLALKVKSSMPELLESVTDIGVITSPMTRCVQTSLFSFPWLAESKDVPFVALETIRETVNYACDRRRSISEIAQEFPRVDFSLHCTTDKDFIWDGYRSRLPNDWDQHMESAELNKIASRTREAFTVLQERPEHHLVVCSHSGEFENGIGTMNVEPWYGLTYETSCCYRLSLRSVFEMHNELGARRWRANAHASNTG